MMYRKSVVRYSRDKYTKATAEIVKKVFAKDLQVCPLMH